MKFTKGQYVTITALGERGIVMHVFTRKAYAVPDESCYTVKTDSGTHECTEEELTAPSGACALSVSPSALQGTNSNDISTLDGTQDALRMRCSNQLSYPGKQANGLVINGLVSLT